MMNDPDRDNSDAFKTLVQAFDQLNKERAHIINNQADVIAKFADQIKNLNFDQKTGYVDNKTLTETKEILVKFNKGDMFDNIKVGSSFNQMAAGYAKTQDVTGVTGDALGNNKLLKVKPI